MKILIVEDHVLMREALRAVLKELKGDAAVIVDAPGPKTGAPLSRRAGGY